MFNKRTFSKFVVTFAVLILAAWLSSQSAKNVIDPNPVAPAAPTPQVLSATNTAASDSWYQVYFTQPGRYEPDQITPLEQALIGHIDQAKTSIDLAYYEFDLEPLAEALINAHDRGVTVRLVYDDEHSDSDPQTQEMIKTGIPAIPDRRSAYMHNKFFVFDGACVWTGSFNYTNNANYRNNENAIYFCQPELAQNYEQEFAELFVSQFGANSPADTPHSQVSFSDVTVENYFAPEDHVMDQVIRTVNSAQTSIHFMAFSFTDAGLAQSMLALSQNGVEVKGIFETRGAGSSSSQCQVLRAHSIPVFLDGNSATFHHKVIIIDQTTVILGSFNFSGNADRSNDENLLIVHDPTLAQKFEAEFQLRLTEAKVAPAFCKSD